MALQQWKKSWAKRIKLVQIKGHATNLAWTALQLRDLAAARRRIRQVAEESPNVHPAPTVSRPCLTTAADPSVPIEDSGR